MVKNMVIVMVIVVVIVAVIVVVIVLVKVLAIVVVRVAFYKNLSCISEFSCKPVSLIDTAYRHKLWVLSNNLVS